MRDYTFAYHVCEFGWVKKSQNEIWKEECDIQKGCVQQWWVWTRTVRRIPQRGVETFRMVQQPQPSSECGGEKRTGDGLQEETACAHPTLHPQHCCGQQPAHQGVIRFMTLSPESSPQPIDPYYLLRRHHWQCAYRQHESSSASERKALSRVVRSAEKNDWDHAATYWEPGKTTLPVRATSIGRAPTHRRHGLFFRPASGRRHHSLSCRTVRFHDSFCPTAIRVLNHSTLSKIIIWFYGVFFIVLHVSFLVYFIHKLQIFWLIDFFVLLVQCRFVLSN